MRLAFRPSFVPSSTWPRVVRQARVLVGLHKPFFLIHPRPGRPTNLIHPATPDRYPRGPWRERARRIALKGLGGGVLYGFVIEPRWLETTWIDFPVPGLPEDLNGYRIVHLTDIHHNRMTGKRYLLRTIRRANALQPDLVALTGDYITHDPDRMRQVARLLGQLHAPDGIVATLGNHDYQLPVGAIRGIFGDQGIRLLEDEHLVVYPRRLVGREGAPPTPPVLPIAILPGMKIAPPPKYDFPELDIGLDGLSAPLDPESLAARGAPALESESASSLRSPWRNRWQRWLHSTGFHRRLLREWHDPPAAYMHLDPEKHAVHHHPFPPGTGNGRAGGNGGGNGTASRGNNGRGGVPDDRDAGGDCGEDEVASCGYSGRGGAPCLCVAGVGDLWEGRCDLEEALQGAPRDIFRLLLSHNPQVANLVSPKHRIGLVLSGHTHGGQTWPLHHAPVFEARARRYLRGMIRSHATNVYVSRGVGSSALHFRWNCRPEITLIRLLRVEENGKG